jgi:hypothetical protein
MEDSVCALLLLHAGRENLANVKRAGRVLEAIMTSAELYDTRWLLSYEANIKGWVKCPAGDHVAGDSNFGLLKRANVSFYDPTAMRLMPRKSTHRVISMPVVRPTAIGPISEAAPEALTFLTYDQ